MTTLIPANTSEANVAAKTHEQLLQEATLKIRQEMEQERLTHLESCIPQRYQGVCFEDFHITCEAQQRVVQALKRFVATFPARLAEGTNLLFLGKSGTGKTWLAYALYRALIRRRVEVLPTSFNTLLLTLRESQPRWSENRLSDTIQRLVRPHLLILDEVALTEHALNFLTAQDRHAIFEIINRRYAALLSTLVISNLDKAALTTLLGTSVMDRLQHNGITLAFDWPSYRTGATATPFSTNPEESKC